MYSHGTPPTRAAKVSRSAVGASMGWRGGGAPGARRPHTRRTKRGSSLRMPTTSTWLRPRSFWPFTWGRGNRVETWGFGCVFRFYRVHDHDAYEGGLIEHKNIGVCKTPVGPATALVWRWLFKGKHYKISLIVKKIIHEYSKYATVMAAQVTARLSIASRVWRRGTCAMRLTYLLLKSHLITHYFGLLKHIKNWSS